MAVSRAQGRAQRGHRARRRARRRRPWHANAWVKAGILLGFRLGRVRPAATGGPFPFFDKDTYPLRALGSRTASASSPAARRSATAATSRRAWSACRRCTSTSARTSDEGTMVDSHALVGSCAQIGGRVHLSRGGADRRRARAGRRAAGDHRGRGAGRRELRRVRRHRSCASAPCSRRGRCSPAARRCSTWCTTASTAATATGRSRFPRAPWSCPAPGRCGRARRGRAGIALYAPVIVKYRDEKTDTAVRLEELLR